MKVVIVGGVAGGASTAARLRRIDEHAEIILFEKGAYISYANCGLPYYIGDVIKERNKLFVQTAQSFNQRFNVDVRTESEVLRIDKDKKEVRVTDLKTNKEYTESYDKLVLSPGAEPIKPKFPGIDMEGIFTLRNVNDTDKIKQYAQSKAGKKAVVVGAGFIGLEMAENLHELGLHVTIVELASQIIPPVDFPIAALAQQHIRSKGVDILLNTGVEGFERSNDDNKSVILNNGNKIEADIVILSIGVKPDKKLAEEAGLTIGSTGGIWVNKYLQTSDENIYAVGDAIEFINPISQKAMTTFLAGPANKQGRICANNIVHGNKHIYKGSINTAIVKVFDLTIGSAGISSKALKRLNIPHIVSTTRSASHASYYPDAKQITIQLAITPNEGKILSAQVCGEDGADKRLDILSSYIQQGLTVYDLMEMEQAYAPPYSSAKDPVNIAAFVGENILTEKYKVEYWDTFLDDYKNDYDGMLIDVRTSQEHQKKTIPGAVNIPLDDLRNRLSEISKDQNLYIFCEVGLRGYLAQRILKQSGYKNVYNLSGGFSLWNVCNEEKNIINNQIKS